MQDYQQLKALFPDVSKAWLRRHAHEGAQVIADLLLEDMQIAPPTRGEDTSGSEGEEEEPQARRRTRPAHFAQPRLPARAAQLAVIDEERREEERQQRQATHYLSDDSDEDENAFVAANEDYAASPARKVIRVERGDGRPLQPNNNNHHRQQQQRHQQRPAAPQQEEDDDDEEEEEFAMTPIVMGEKCSGGCGLKPRGARVFCEDYQGDEKKQHTLCVRCLQSRWQAGILLRDPDAYPPARVYYTCPMRNCNHRIWSAELRAATREHAPAVYDAITLELQRLRQRVQQARRAAAADDSFAGDDDEEQEEKVQQPQPRERPANLQLQPASKEMVKAALGSGVRKQDESEPPRTPVASHARPPLRLSWTPRHRREGASAAAAAGDGAGSVEEEEEPVVSEQEEQDLRDMAAFVDKDKLQQLQGYFPATALGWLLRHSDYGMEWLIDMVHNQNKADPKQRPRADGRGATTVVQSVLASRKKFECSVCFADYDEHLAIACVYLPKRRRTMMPGEVAPSAAQLATEEKEQRKGTHEEHKFCAECVNGHARAATEQNVILEAGVGIKCMEPSCRRALLRAHVDQVLDMQTRATLDPLFSNEALLAADCQDVEKCQRCSFAAVMIDREEQPVFVCANRPACGHMHCRKCGRTWDSLHKNRTCEELDPEAMRKRVEEQLTAAAMYRCPRCKRGIVKIDGCNKITCPCGQLSCYVCKASIENYKHFKNGPADSDDQTKCPLWVDPTAQIEKERLKLLRQQIAGAADEGIRDMLHALF